MTTKTIYQALADARTQLAADLEALREASTTPGSGAVEDESDRDAIATYAELVARIDYALVVAGERMVPDARRLTTCRTYLQGLVEQSGLSTRACARAIGIDDGELRGYLRGHRTWPYPVQFALEQLAGRPR